MTKARESVKAESRVKNKFPSEHKTERAQKSGRRKSLSTGEKTPRRLTTRPITGVTLNMPGQSTVQINASSHLIKLRPMISVSTQDHWETIWQPYCQRSMREVQPTVVDTGSGWAFSSLTSSFPMPTYCHYSCRKMPSTSLP